MIGSWTGKRAKKNQLVSASTSSLVSCPIKNSLTSLDTIFHLTYNDTFVKLISSLFIVLGSSAGIVEHVGMFPLDTIKVSVTDSLNLQHFALFLCLPTFYPDQ